MKHYRDPDTNEVFAFEEDGSQDSFISSNLIPISNQELSILRAPPPVDPQVAISGKLAQLRSVRESILNRLTGIASRSERKGDTATASACDVAALSLLDITKDLPVDLEAMSTEVKNRYKSIVAIASNAAPGLVSAFAGMDL